MEDSNSCVEHVTYIILALTLMKNMLDYISLYRGISNSTLKSRKRRRDAELPYHLKRKRVSWSQLVASLGPDEFKKHHRVSRKIFATIHSKIKHLIRSKVKYARKTCCRDGVSHVDSRSKLSMTLKHLAGSRTYDIERTHGVSRSTVVQSIAMTLDAIIVEFGIPPFPLDNEEQLQKLADGFKQKSTGGLFDNVIGAFDGFLLQISKRAIGKQSGVKDPSKYYCRKGYYAINCQVCCDCNRKVTYLSMLCPGAVPDRLAHLKGSMHRAIETGQVPARYHFVGDNAYPPSDQMLTPCTRTQLRDDLNGCMDNYNFYLSQLRINIECCFGMLVNKFGILQSALLTPKLGTACKTFVVCCILHNMCIDERLEEEKQVSFPASLRYTQRPAARTQQLREDDDFEFVESMDETTANELIAASHNVGPTYVEEDTTCLSVKDKMIRKIAELGYVRPK